MSVPEPPSVGGAYWVWASEPAAQGEVPVHGRPPVAAQLYAEVDSGVVVSMDAPLVEIVQDESSQCALTDSLPVRGGGLLFSSRLREVLASIALDNVQYYPVVVRNLVDGTQSTDYHLANIVGRVACIDRENAVYDTAPDDADEIEIVDVLAIDEAKACGFDLFRLHEDAEVVIASDRVKEACERHRITGVRFYEPGDYPI